MFETRGDLSPGIFQESHIVPCPYRDLGLPCILSKESLWCNDSLNEAHVKLGLCVLIMFTLCAGVAGVIFNDFLSGSFNWSLLISGCTLIAFIIFWGFGLRDNYQSNIRPKLIMANDPMGRDLLQQGSEILREAWLLLGENPPADKEEVKRILLQKAAQLFDEQQAYIKRIRGNPDNKE